MRICKLEWYGGQVVNASYQPEACLAKKDLAFSVVLGQIFLCFAGRGAAGAAFQCAYVCFELPGGKSRTQKFNRYVL